jgi:zinc transporter 1
VELAAGVWVDSLVLLSDGFHNLSDVISLYIAYWAQQAQKRDLSDEMSYGWVRSEILGGLTNGCFLLAICLYVVLEAIPKFITPEPIEAGWIFIIVAAGGLAVNTLGTIVFCITGQGHSHGGGGGHSHSHGGHSHGHDKKKKEKKHKEGHSHSHENGEAHSHSHEKKEKKQKKEGHSHSHEGGHGHDHKKKKKAKRDMNVHAVFLHYLGDAISSLMVLIAGFFIYFFKGQKWTEYIDPVSSLIIVGLILWTTVPLVKRCSMILLQSTPVEVEMEKVRQNLLSVEGILSLHDLHVWQLVDGMIIASVHVSVEEGADFTTLVNEVKRIFHEFGIHSSSIQPEFVPRNFQDTAYCEQNCVRECDEDWCCKKTATKQRQLMEQFSISMEV